MNIIDNVSELLLILSNWEFLGYLSIAAVALCCLGEFIHECTTWFKKYSWWRANGGAVSALLLVIALAVELAIQVKANSISGRVIANLSRRAADAQLETARLNAIIAPRSLTDLEKQTAIKKTRFLYGKKIIVTSLTSDSEAYLFGQQIIELLRKEEANVVDLRGKFIPAGGYLTGIHVGGPDTGVVQIILSTLPSRLNHVEDQENSNMVLSMPGNNEVIGASASVFVGTKPSPE